MSVAQAMYFSTNFLHSTLLFFCNHTENPISSKTVEGKPQLLQQGEASREVKENEAQKNQTEPWTEQGNRFIGHHAEGILAWVAAFPRIVY